MNSTFDLLIKNLETSHKNRLLWFQKNKNEEFNGWLPNYDEDKLLATKAKGIYKPKELKYALSIRMTKDGPYEDKIENNEENKVLTIKYFQENKDIRERDTEYTNLGLKKCMIDNVPIGIIKQLEKRPNSKYQVIGTGIIKKWDNGYYHINVFDNKGEIG